MASEISVVYIVMDGEIFDEEGLDWLAAFTDKEEAEKFASMNSDWWVTDVELNPSFETWQQDRRTIRR